MREHETDDLGDIVDIDMIAALFAFAEQNDRFSTIGKTAEFVRSIAVMRIAGAVNKRRPQDRERRSSGRSEQHLLAREMHRAVETGRRSGRRFVERQRPVGIDGVRTDIDQMRNRPLRQSLADRRHHADILEHHRRRLAGRARRNDDQCVIGTQQGSQIFTGLLGEEIDVFAPQPGDGAA